MIVKPLWQRDDRWSAKKLGFSTLSIGGYGCTLTCLTMLLNYVGYAETPNTVNDTLKTLGNYDRLNNPQGAFSGALLVWANIQRKYPKIKFAYRDYNYSNPKVWVWINVWPKMPVLVEVNGAKIGSAKHWVLFKGNQLANDPWFGKEISTNTYPLTGDAFFRL